MKILHVGPIKASRTSTGPSHSIRALATTQAKLGHDVALLNSMPTIAGTQIEESPGVCLLEGPRKKHYNPWFISHEWQSRIQEKFGTPDIVHFHTFNNIFQCALSKRCVQQKWPYIISPRAEMTYLAQGAKRTKKRIANLLCFNSHVKHAVAIHTLTTRETEESRVLFKFNKAIIVPNGIEDYLLEAAEKLLPADLGEFARKADLILGFVGRIEMYHKGLDLLLRAMAILKSQHIEFNCKLFLVGPFHRKNDKLAFNSVVESLGIKGNIKLLGPKFSEEKLRYFLACDVFVHTSRFEGMPMAVLEAMALKRPCLVTPGTNMADVVRQGGGWECQPNPQSIAEAIKSIYKEKDSFQALGLKSHKLIQSQFTWHKVAQQLCAEYTKIIKQNVN